jgi:hypothetical protein
MKEFKVGDKVVMKGIVVSKHIHTEHEYKVCVNWNNHTTLIKQYYYQDGRCSTIDTEPAIFHDTTQERLVQVRDYVNDIWYTRVLLMQKNDKYICWEDAETIEEAESKTRTTVWNFMREVPEKKTITMKEIAEKFGIDVEQIEIKK